MLIMSISVIGLNLTSGIMLQWQLWDGGRAVNNTTWVRKICILYIFKYTVHVYLNQCRCLFYIVLVLGRRTIQFIISPKSSVTSHKNLGLRPRFLWNIIYSPVGLVYNISVTDFGSMINPSSYGNCNKRSKENN